MPPQRVGLNDHRYCDNEIREALPEIGKTLPPRGGKNAFFAGRPFARLWNVGENSLVFRAWSLDQQRQRR